MPDITDPTPRSGSRGGRHYPGRNEYDAANANFRRQVAKVFRDRDPATSAKAATLVAEVTAAIEAVTRKAYQAQEDSTVSQAQMRRLEANLARLERRAGLPEGSLSSRRPPGDDAA